MAVRISVCLVFSAAAGLLFLLSAAPPSVADDTAALNLFRNQTDIHGTLLSNWTSNVSCDPAAAAACSGNWRGVGCLNNRVIAVSLKFLNLRGPIEALSSLDQLRALDLRGNRLNGSISSMVRCVNLQRVNLSGNDFSGEIPAGISSLRSIRTLDLSDNNLHGVIPAEFSNLSRLHFLRLQNNQLSGTIPNSLDSLTRLRELDLSNNELFGILPVNLSSRFGLSSFSGNPGLCGVPPFPNCSSSIIEPTPSIPNSTSPLLPNASIPDSSTTPHSSHKLNTGDIVTITVVISFLLVSISLVCMLCYCRSRSIPTPPRSQSSSSSNPGEPTAYAADNESSRDSITTNNGRGEIVFFDRSNLFGVEDLLQSSAVVIGKGSLGTVYKAIVNQAGFTVAVKRLRDGNPCSRREFELYMNGIGRLQHQNVVRLIGYYYATEEKLLVYDYMPNGNLHSLIHDSRRAGKIPLDWTTRIILTLGAARGLLAIHSVTGIPHANVKSSNVLLDKNGMACLADFALSFLLSPSESISKYSGYRAPEQFETLTHSMKADVYSFGVLLLEVLTGRPPNLDLPRWVRRLVGEVWRPEVFDPALLRYKNIEGEMRMMLRVAMACVATPPENRPEMAEVVRMIEEVRVELSPHGGRSDVVVA